MAEAGSKRAGTDWRQTARNLYFGSTRDAKVFRYSLLAFDIASIAVLHRLVARDKTLVDLCCRCR